MPYIRVRKFYSPCLRDSNKVGIEFCQMVCLNALK